MLRMLFEESPLHTASAEDLVIAMQEMEALRARLTEKQWRVALLMAAGYRQREIAAEMGAGQSAVSYLCEPGAAEFWAVHHKSGRFLVCTW